MFLAMPASGIFRLEEIAHMTSTTRSRLTRATLAALLLATAFAVRSLALGPGQSFTFLHAGFTQELIGATQDLGDLFDDDGDGTPDNILGGVAFAPDGDPVVTDCNFAGTRLHRFDRQSTTAINGTDVWPETVLPSAGGCGIVNHPDGTAYIAMDDGINGVANVDLETGCSSGSWGRPPTRSASRSIRRPTTSCTPRPTAASRAPARSSASTR
jgi:hypothetical protein